MLRARFASVSITALQAEIQRRTRKLKKLIARRDRLNQQIAELQGGPGRGEARKPVSRPRGRRRVFKQTAQQFILKLVRNRPRTTAQINAAWKRQGRAGSANNTLGKLVKDKKLRREKIKGARGSKYSLA
jgi:cell division protein FtsB